MLTNNNMTLIYNILILIILILMLIFICFYCSDRFKICQTIQSTGKLQLSENKVKKIYYIIYIFFNI